MEIKYITNGLFSIMDKNKKGLNTGGALCENGTILFGCDDRLTPDVICNLGLPPVCAIFCNDYRRSINGGVVHFDGAEKFIHENFYEFFTEPELWWDNPKNRWYLYKFRPDADILSTGVSRVNKLTNNEQITLGSISITALFTPGDTDFSMTFII